MKRIILATVAAAALWGGTASAQTSGPGGDAALKAAVQADYDANLGALFDWFHRNPELSGREVQTSARMAQELTALGYDVTTGVGGTGVVAVLRNGVGPTVMIRADMDGLPLQERSGLANASTARQIDADGTEKPVMHACGHDVHITALVGTARQMAARKANWSGTLVLIAQPAEERIFGARMMIEDGLYTRFPKPDYALAGAASPAMPLSSRSLRPAAFASGDGAISPDLAIDLCRTSRILRAWIEDPADRWGR